METYFSIIMTLIFVPGVVSMAFGGFQYEPYKTGWLIRINAKKGPC